MGFTVRSPGSWLGGSWVSALLIGVLFLHLHCDLAVMSGWLDLLSARSFLNSSAHKLPSSTEHVHRTGCLLFRFVGCAFWVFLFGLVLFCVCLFLFFFGLPLFRLHSGLDSGLRNGPRSLSTPQCGMLIYAMHNSFTGTNTVLRPGESREGEGRKKRVCPEPLLPAVEAHPG